MSKSWSPEFENQVLKAANYRQFLGLFFEKKGPKELSSPRPLTYQQFSQKAGFSSKSFAADIIAGRKRITPLSLQKVVQGLSLNKSWSDYFKAMVAKEEPLFWTEKKSAADFSKDVIQYKNRLSKKGKILKPQNKPGETEILGHPHFPTLFASLGSPETGASLTEIQSRSRLDLKTIQPLLDHLIRLRWITFAPQTQRFHPDTACIDFVQMGADKNFVDDYLRSLQTIKNRFPKLSHKMNCTFMTQTFVVDKAQLPELNHRLKELLLDFCNQAESPNGDLVAELLISFSHNDN